MVKFNTVLDQIIPHIHVQFGVLWLNREAVVNGNALKSMAAVAATAEFLPKMKKSYGKLKMNW